MEQRRTSDHIVFPIFYHVNPSDVRKQRNSFGDAMAEHKQRLKIESNAEKRIQLAQKIEKWEKALTEVADMKGEEAANGRRETILIERIVKEIISRLQLEKRCKVPPIIGMESSIRKITSFLKDGSGQSTRVMTIWGMAGIGKTYLANYIFRMNYRNFERSCFLEDIEGKCTKIDGLLNLQKQLLKDMRAGSYMDINNVNEGTFNIENLLFLNRTLLVLDGVNKLEQLDALIGTKGLHPGSKIMVTSKNESLTEKCKLFETEVPPKHTKHWVQGLSDEESFKLLSWHAFGCYEPSEYDKKQSMKVVKYCQGHPLALKVLGGSFRSEDATWEDILESLGKEINPDITKVLKISFDNLPSEKDKELFKYIACLFVGEYRKFSEDILKACGICRSSGMKVLINRSLLTESSYDNTLIMHQLLQDYDNTLIMHQLLQDYDITLIMHQLLQDMGREIVRQESTKIPWNRSVLWHHEECLDVLQNKQGASIIQGLSLNMRTSENGTLKESIVACMQMFALKSFLSFSWVHILLSIIWWLFGWVSGMRSSSHKIKGDFNTIALSEMHNLRILRLNYVKLSGSYEHFPQGLRWLCMHGFPLSYIPSDLQMENMVALDLSYSKLQKLWEKPKFLGSLKFLNLTSCRELVRVGDFSMLPLLERLILTRCTSLVEVCESIGASCQNLEVLDLSECLKLKVLPRSIGKLVKLTHLILDGCPNHGELLVEMMDTESLKVLTSHGCSSSTIFPRSSKSLVSLLPSSLVKLSLANCNFYTESFPKDCSSLSMLKVLCLDGNPFDSLPDFVRNLSRLENLSVSRCHSLRTIMCLPIQLQILNFSRCHSLEKVNYHPEELGTPKLIRFVADSNNRLIEFLDWFKMQGLSEIGDEVLNSLGWNNVEYLNHCWFSKAYITRDHKSFSRKLLRVPAQMLYEPGIFSTYLQGEKVPEWFTHRSNGSSFTLQSSPKNGNIKGINVCVVHTISKVSEVDHFRIKIMNLTKNSSRTYVPMMNLLLQDDDFEKEVVWLSHWMFGRNEFEDGDEVSIDFSVIGYCEGPNYVNVKEYGISLVYDDDVGRNQKDPLAYYKSWNRMTMSSKTRH